MNDANDAAAAMPVMMNGDVDMKVSLLVDDIKHEKLIQNHHQATPAADNNNSLSSLSSSSSSSSSCGSSGAGGGAGGAGGGSDGSNSSSSEYHLAPAEQYHHHRRPVHWCAGCGTRIADRFYSVADERVWHNDCLRCCECRALLDADFSCYMRHERIYCRQDYFRCHWSMGNIYK